MKTNILIKKEKNKRKEKKNDNEKKDIENKSPYWGIFNLIKTLIFNIDRLLL
jgi:hypothetical protein